MSSAPDEGESPIHNPSRTPASPSRRRVRAIAALALGGALIVAPLGGAAATASAAGDSILKIATSSDIDTLNPFTAILASSTGIMSLQYEALAQYGAADNSVVPGLASKWTTSSDGLVWKFTIPADREWSDGKPLTAKDAAYTFTAIQDDEKLAQANGGLLTNIDSVTAPDDRTVKITLKEAQAPNPGAELPIVPEHIWKAIKNPSAFANDKNDVGSGPFIVKSYEKGQSVQLVANSKFWRGAPKIDGITYVYYKNGDAQVQALKTGEVDIVSGLQPAQYASLKGVKGVTLNAGAGRRYTALAINPGAKDATGAPLGDGNPALQDKTLRTAIVSAIDNKTLLAKVKQGLGVLGQTAIPPVYPQYFGIAKSDVIPFDPKAANAALDKAGYRMGGDGIRLDKTGKPLQLRLLGRSSDPTHAQMAEYIGPWLKAIGIGTSVVMEADNQVNDDSTLGKYDLYFTGWGIGPDPDFQMSINTCASFPNADGSGALSESNWCDPAFDTLFAAQHVQLDPAKRATIVKKAMAVIYGSAVNDVIWYADSLEAYRSDRFTGFVTQPSKGGVITGQNGYWGLYSATPVSATSASPAPNVGAIVGIIVLVVILAGGVTFVVLRRRRVTADDRE
jgi:peptide/nickel transport system substrate-binding protein